MMLNVSQEMHISFLPFSLDLIGVLFTPLLVKFREVNILS